MAKKGGTPCQAQNSAEVRACNTDPCGQAQYCAWAEWSDWSSCSATCGTGQQVRARSLQVTVTKPEEKDIMVTSILDELTFNLRKLEGKFSAEHILLTFVGGMLVSLALLVFVFNFVRRRRVAGTAVSVEESEEFQGLNQQLNQQFIE